MGTGVRWILVNWGRIEWGRRWRLKVWGWMIWIRVGLMVRGIIIVKCRSIEWVLKSCICPQLMIKKQKWFKRYLPEDEMITQWSVKMTATSPDLPYPSIEATTTICSRNPMPEKCDPPSKITTQTTIPWNKSLKGNLKKGLRKGKCMRSPQKTCPTSTIALSTL